MKKHDMNPFCLWAKDFYVGGMGAAVAALDGVQFTPKGEELYNIRLYGSKEMGWRLRVYQTKGGDFSMLSPAGPGGIGFESDLPEGVKSRIKERMVALVESGLNMCKELLIILAEGDYYI